MKRRFFSVAVVLTLAAALGVIGVTRQCALAQTEETIEWIYEWTAPTSGSPVDHYEIQVHRNGDLWQTDETDGDETHRTITVTFGDDISVRVRGVDASGRRGQWSAASNVETVEKDPPTNTSGAR